jgi:Helix-turn-helix domain
MARRHPNHRLVKTHRNYTVDEVAALFKNHRNTVREWIRRGLPTCDARRPILILGPDLIAFLQAKRAKNKRTCAPGQLYCVRCRAPREAAGGFAEYRPLTPTLGCLAAICSICETVIHRRVNPTRLEQIRGTLDISGPVPQSQLDEMKTPFVNSDFKPSAADGPCA